MNAGHNFLVIENNNFTTKYDEAFLKNPNVDNNIKSYGRMNHFNSIIAINKKSKVFTTLHIFLFLGFHCLLSNSKSKHHFLSWKKKKSF